MPVVNTIHGALLLVAILLFAVSAVPAADPASGRIARVGLAFLAAAFLFS